MKLPRVDARWLLAAGCFLTGLALIVSVALIGYVAIERGEKIGRIGRTSAVSAQVEKRLLDKLDALEKTSTKRSKQLREVLALLRAHGIEVPATTGSPPTPKASPSPKADRGSGPVKPKSSPSPSKPTKPSKPTNPVTPSPPMPTPTSGPCLLDIVCLG